MVNQDMIGKKIPLNYFQVQELLDNRFKKNQQENSINKNEIISKCYEFVKERNFNKHKENEESIFQELKEKFANLGEKKRIQLLSSDFRTAEEMKNFCPEIEEKYRNSDISNIIKKLQSK